MTTGKIIDSIKRVSIDASRVRQLLPGLLYQYPPAQDKISYKEITAGDLADLAQSGNSKAFLSRVRGLSPAIAIELSLAAAPEDRIAGIDVYKIQVLSIPMRVR